MKTIIALTTNTKDAAIALIRISGEKSFSLTQKLIKLKLTGVMRTVRKIYIKNNFIDEVVINCYPKPHSFTGEDVIEISTHPNKIIINEIISFYINHGCAYAKAGEFLERAFINNKITFNQAQLINEIIKSKSIPVLNLYRKGFKEKNFRYSIKRIRDQIAEIIMKSDVDVEYPEYEKANSKKIISNNLEKIIKQVTEHLKQIELIEMMNKGVKIAIIGSPNSGKSTLFNKLLNKERVIVTNIPGTTTDYIEEKMQLDNGIEITLVDTAGIRKTSKLIEKKGIELSKKLFNTANLILWLEEEETNFQNPILKDLKAFKILSKCDLAKTVSKNQLVISAKNNINIDKLILLIKKEVMKIIKKIDQGEIIFISNKNSLKQVLHQLKHINEVIKTSSLTIDIFRSHLNECLDITNMLIGESKTYNYIEEIFRTFCIGK